MLGRHEELDSFKQQISLVEYALARGYQLNRRASSRCSAVLEDGRGDKIVVARGADGHWIYFSVRDDSDSGTIIDFVQRRCGLNLGEVRKELRSWLGAPSPNPTGDRLELTPAAKDLVRVQAQLEGMEISPAHPYLRDERAIPEGVLRDGRFAGTIRNDIRGNAIFPHRGAGGGFCGYELKNRGFTGFAPGGQKGLWLSNRRETDVTLVLCESGIDALSHFALKRPEAARYVSIAGSLNPAQPDLICRAVGKMKEGATAVIAVDNDEGGDKLLHTIKIRLEHAGIRCIDDRPAERGMDWNDVLKTRI